MTCADEGKSHNSEPKKSKLLPTGGKAKELIEVLAAMYRAMHNPENATNDDDRSEHANQCRDAGPEKEGEEQTR